MMLNTSGKVVANYWLNEVFSPEAGQAHRRGDIHIHDLDMLAGYCAGWSLRQLLEQGFGGVPGAISSGPPKHLSSALGQMVNFLGTLQNEWAGAQAFSSFDTYLAPYVRLDNLDYSHVRQCMQEFIFNLNVPSRWGTQTPFTNLTFDWTCPTDIAEDYPFIGGDIRSMCCRLQLDLRELLKRGNGLFGSAEQTGSIGVVTLNCARLGHLYKGDEAALLEAVTRFVRLGVDTLERKRRYIAKLLEAGLFPYTQRWLPSLDNHFSTIGVNGCNEMIRNFTGDTEDITTPAGHAQAARLLDHINTLLVEAQEATGHLYNLEATPAEGATYRFAREDIARYPGIIHAGTADEPYYTNSTQLPVAHTPDPFDALAKQDDLQTKYTGGTVLHLYMGAAMSNGDACAALVRRALTHYRLPYITITPTFSICPNHGYLSGDHPHCPRCCADTEVWTRVMGYFRPVASFNTGKKGEFHERTYFREPSRV